MTNKMPGCLCSIGNFEENKYLLYLFQYQNVTTLQKD